MSLSLPLTRQRCAIHLEREAAARCPSCERFFCRECVTEHDGRLLCAACLRALLAAAQRPARARRAWKKPLWNAARAVVLASSLFASWFFFHLLGHKLTSLPDEFHVDKLWGNAAGMQEGDD